MAAHNKMNEELSKRERERRITRNIKIVIFIALFVAILSGIGFFYAIGNPLTSGTESLNITYAVRDVHLGYVNAASIIVVEYYDGDEIKMIDNKDLNYCEPTRENIITIKRSLCDESWLVHYERSFGYRIYPRGRYILYLSDDKVLNGIDTNYPHSRRPDEETFIN